MMNIKDTLSTHRSERAAHRQLAHELADYTSAADRLEIETIAARYSPPCTTHQRLSPVFEKGGKTRRTPSTNLKT
jgi:hypothetical protein